jgi:hypothetical protein
MLEIILILSVLAIVAVIVIAANNFQANSSKAAQQTIQPISEQAVQHIVQKLGFQESKNKRWSFPRYIGKYQDYRIEIFVDSDDFLTMQMFFSNSKQLIFQVQKKSGDSSMDKLIEGAFNSKDIFIDKISYKKFAIHTRPSSLREKLFSPNSPIWDSLRRFPSFDCSLEVGFSVRETNALTYQHFYANEVSLAMMTNLLKIMGEICDTLQAI